MPSRTSSLQNEAIDAIIYRVLGTVDETLLDEAFDLNPDIAEWGLVIPAGVTVVVPDLPASPTTKGVIRLYD